MTESPLRKSLLMYRSLFCCVDVGGEEAREEGKEGGRERGGRREDR